MNTQAHLAFIRSLSMVSSSTPPSHFHTQLDQGAAFFWQGTNIANPEYDHTCMRRKTP
jgi:hypothetical protein